MVEVMVSAAATSVMGSVIGKLAAMLTEKYKLAKDVERGIRFLQEELSSMDAVLQMLAEKDDDQIDPRAKDWRSKVRELSYDIEGCIDCFMLNHSQGGSKANFVRKAMRKPVLLDPRAPGLFQEASNLVGIDAPREEIIRLLKCEEKQHKVVSIYGIGGQGKTILAMEVYHKIIGAFDCRAFVSVSQTPDMKRLLTDILSQISKSHFDQSQMLETVEQLIRTVKECLKDKRYFILIDDIWSESAWDLVRSALPVNDNGSRIITTTRSKAVANKCCTGIAAQMYEAKPLMLVHKHASEFLNNQILRVLNIESQFVGCSLGHVKSFGQLKYLRAGHQSVGVLKLPEDIEKLQHLETLDFRGSGLENLPASIMLLQKLVRLFVRDPVHLPDEIRNLQALEELSDIDLDIQSVEFIQGLGDLTNLRILGIDWPCSRKLRDMEGHKEACISTVSRLFRHLRELRAWDRGPDATCSFMASCVPTPPPLQKLLLNTINLNRVGPQISSLVNLSRLYIGVYGEAGKEGINILASLPMRLSLTVGLSNDQDGDSGILYARHAISRQGFQRLVKFNVRSYNNCEVARCQFKPLEFEPGAMPKLQMLKLLLVARCQFKFGESGLVLGLQNLADLKHDQSSKGSSCYWWHGASSSVTGHYIGSKSLFQARVVYREAKLWWSGESY
ncbi:unnamed protein product [Miscanthus lutarioriparius]|uniref:Uncharacterized protein n=1 Tax=Miscanthus lutarioriparius TaxID=422564 RepID=A0A811QIV5_9POAL|nr:unnamed protein product [Miscanthus lutarioriparius]